MHRALLLLAVALAACGGSGDPTPTPGGAGAIVLVSGRDDHGLLQMAEVPLVTEPEGTEVATRVPDGAFAEVLEIRGTWLLIRPIADPSSSGWIDDFWLRSRAVLHNVQQVRFLQARVGDGGIVEVQVQAVDADVPPRWVAEDHLDEVGADIEPHEH